MDARPQRSRSGCKTARDDSLNATRHSPFVTVVRNEAGVRVRKLVTTMAVGNFSTGFSRCHSPSQLGLLRHWCEKTSQIMVLDPESNPFSLPILEYLEISPSLMPTILSISAVHEQFIEKECLETSPEEQEKALLLLEKELGGRQQPHPITFLSAFMLGNSTP
ncbi:hypothetical protein N7467_000679 [Penicillium canescens]|nr:hypothetical protein N7467_000679 [Penicillium canescens]